MDEVLIFLIQTHKKRRKNNLINYFLWNVLVNAVNAADINNTHI